MTNEDTQRFRMSRGCVMVKNNEKRPMVKVQWREGGKVMCKSFCIGKKKSKEQALEEAKKYHEENIIPKYEEWKINFDKETKIIKKEKHKIWKQKDFKCECGSDIHNGNKTRHMKSQKHTSVAVKEKPPVPPRPSKEYMERIKSQEHIKKDDDDDRCNMCGYMEHNCHCGCGYGKYY